MKTNMIPLRIKEVLNINKEDEKEEDDRDVLFHHLIHGKYHQYYHQYLNQMPKYQEQMQLIQ
jgi:hypothetical protein